MSAGQQVRFVDPRKGFWRFGKLVKLGRKWARVETAIKTYRVPVGDVQKWEAA